MVMSCDALSAQTRVTGKAARGLDFRAMEEKEPSEIAIDIDEHQHMALSDAVLLLGEIREASQESRQHLEVLREGTAHCILAWFVEARLLICSSLCRGHANDGSLVIPLPLKLPDATFCMVCLMVRKLIPLHLLAILTLAACRTLRTPF